jgi:hypothetical protein
MFWKQIGVSVGVGVSWARAWGITPMERRTNKSGIDKKERLKGWGRMVFSNFMFLNLK